MALKFGTHLVFVDTLGVKVEDTLLLCIVIRLFL